MKFRQEKGWMCNFFFFARKTGNGRRNVLNHPNVHRNNAKVELVNTSSATWSLLGKLSCHFRNSSVFWRTYWRSLDVGWLKLGFLLEPWTLGSTQQCVWDNCHVGSKSDCIFSVYSSISFSKIPSSKSWYSLHHVLQMVLQSQLYLSPNLHKDWHPPKFQIWINHFIRHVTTSFQSNFGLIWHTTGSSLGSLPCYL